MTIISGHLLHPASKNVIWNTTPTASLRLSLPPHVRIRTTYVRPSAAALFVVETRLYVVQHFFCFGGSAHMTSTKWDNDRPTMGHGWAVRPARAGSYFRAELSSADSKTRYMYTVFASLANILPKSNGWSLPASLPKSPHFTQKRYTNEGRV